MTSFAKLRGVRRGALAATLAAGAVLGLAPAAGATKRPVSPSARTAQPPPNVPVNTCGNGVNPPRTGNPPFGNRCVNARNPGGGSPGKPGPG